MRSSLALASLALAMLIDESFAQEFKKFRVVEPGPGYGIVECGPFRVRCDSHYTGLAGPGVRKQYSKFAIVLDDNTQTRNDAALRRILNSVKERETKFCPASPNGLLIYIVRRETTDFCPLEVMALYTKEDQIWHIYNEETFKEERRKKEAAEASKRDKENAAAKEKKAKFTKEFGIDRFVDARALRTNPYVFENQVIALPATFDRMIGRRQALFNADGPLIVEAVPATLFSERRKVMLAAKFVDIKDVPNEKGFAAKVVTLRYVGSTDCAQADCSDFSD